MIPVGTTDNVALVDDRVVKGGIACNNEMLFIQARDPITTQQLVCANRRESEPTIAITNQHILALAPIKNVFLGETQDIVNSLDVTTYFEKDVYVDQLLPDPVNNKNVIFSVSGVALNENVSGVYSWNTVDDTVTTIYIQPPNSFIDFMVAGGPRAIIVMVFNGNITIPTIFDVTPNGNFFQIGTIEYPTVFITFAAASPNGKHILLLVDNISSKTMLVYSNGDLSQPLWSIDLTTEGALMGLDNNFVYFSTSSTEIQQVNVDTMRFLKTIPINVEFLEETNDFSTSNVRCALEPTGDGTNSILTGFSTIPTTSVKRMDDHAAATNSSRINL
jgi:hypothetical protein